MKRKTDATILGIIYHPEIRDVLSKQGKKDIIEMVRTLVSEVYLFSQCPFCDFICGLEKKPE